MTTPVVVVENILEKVKVNTHSGEILDVARVAPRPLAARAMSPHAPARPKAAAAASALSMAQKLAAKAKAKRAAEPAVGFG